MNLSAILIGWFDEATLGFINHLSWQQILWLQTAWFEPEDDPPDGGLPLIPWSRLRRDLCFQKKMVVLP